MSQKQTVLYRGIGTTSVPLVSSGLLSTSPQVGEAAKYVGVDLDGSRPSGHLIRIIVPAGCHLLDPAEFGIYNPYDSGDEVILLPGSLTPVAHTSSSNNDDEEDDNLYYRGSQVIPITTYLYAEIANAAVIASQKVLMFQRSSFPDYVRQAPEDDEGEGDSDNEDDIYYDGYGNPLTEAEYQKIQEDLKKMYSLPY